ncbi:MAG: SGNH/GDSL hydrolase family protein [Cyanobacteria bacterium]|nr:SGNH/GDSL hydrolase family protein [Cyanobacteriota bacterium]
MATFFATTLLGTLPAKARISNLSNLFSFGDSLSDSGNSKSISQSAIGSIIPPPPYYDGRFSNGPVAIEYLWQIFNPGGTAFKNSLSPGNQGTNYAIGGSSSGLQNYLELLSSSSAYSQKGNSWQLTSFASQNQTFDPDTSLFSVWFFPNDLFWYNNSSPNSLPGTYTGDPGAIAPPAGYSAVVGNAVYNIIGTITKLANSHGARHFLVPNSPLIGDTPEFAGTSQQSILNQLSIGFNNLLQTNLDHLTSTRPELDIIQFQTDDVQQEILNNPSLFGFTDVKTRCISNATCVTNAGGAAEDWFYWDGTHPTTSGHEIFAQRIYQAVYQPVPAPLPLVGVAAGFAWSRQLRRRIKSGRAKAGAPQGS